MQPRPAPHLPGRCATSPSRPRSDESSRTSYLVLGARKMHAIRGRPEIAERHGAGHVARCTVERLMGDLGLRGVRRARSPRTTRSAPREQCPADLVRRHFEVFAPGGLWVADVPPRAGGAPSYVARLLRVGLCGFRDRRVLAEDHRLADLHESVHRPGPRRPGDGRLAAETSGGRPDGPGASLATERCSTGPSATGLPWPSARRSPRWGRRATPMTTPWPRALNFLYKAELIRNQGPWEDIDAACARHRRVGPLGGHHRATLRYRYANPCRARSRLGARPPPPRTITTGNHRHQINQPPQNPRLDTRPLPTATTHPPHL